MSPNNPVKSYLLQLNYVERLRKLLCKISGFCCDVDGVFVFIGCTQCILVAA
jgi:hypothetical protein